jgi:ribosomal protein L11 methyltransferase
MSWMELSVDTTREAVDWVCTLLGETQPTADVQVAPYQPTPESLPDAAPWAFTICFYLPYDTRASASVDAIDQQLSPLHRTGLTTELQVSVIAEKPDAAIDPLIHRVGQRFVVLAPDTPYRSQPEEIPLRLKTSLAFGSGLHPATMLSLRLIERYVVPSMNALDLGSGSGILSVAMAKLGAQVLALDNDSIAVQATQDAIDRNGVAQQVTAMAGSLGRGSNLGHWMNGHLQDTVPSIAPSGAFDLIVANILARVHIDLAPDFQQALRRDRQPGLLITAGFTTDYEADVTSALVAVGFETIDAERSNEWVALIHRLT